MNRLTKLISATVALAAIMGGTLIAGHSLASVPCIQYTDTNLQTSQTPLFNDICGVPSLLSSSDGTYPIGDEPDFVRIRPNISGDDTVSKDNPKLTNNLTSACTDGSKFDVWTYVHNDASQDFNDNGTGSAVAHDVKVALAAQQLNTTNDNFTFGSTISASNGSPVSDTTTLNCGGKQVTLSLVPSSVHYNNDLNQTTYGNLSDSAVNSSTGIGSPVFPTNGLGGDEWGCWNYRMVIVYQVVVKNVPTPVVTATCDFFKVLASSDRKVTVSQFTFTGVNAAFSSAVIDWGDGSAPTTTGSPVGLTHQYTADGSFTIKVTAHFMIAGVDVAVTSDACQQTITLVPTPAVFTCDLFDIKSDAASRTVTATALNTTATNGAVFKNAVIDWGDGTAPTLSATPVGQTHQYAKDGTYNVTATAHFTVNGQDVSATSAACQKQVTFTPPPPAAVFTCDLFDIKSDAASRTVTATAFTTTAKNGAVFTNAVIDWGDGTAPTTSATPVGTAHQYIKDGTFTIKATAHFTVNGQDVTATSAACQKQIVFTPPVTPVFTCDLFDIKSDAATRTVTALALNTTALNGAVFNNVVIDWGDGSTPLTSLAPAGQTHQYTKDGTFNITATAHFTVNGHDVTATSANCQKQVKFVTPPVFTCDLFDIKADAASRTVTAKAFKTTAANGAVFTNAVIDWGDGSTPTTSATPVGTAHQYAKDGTFNITATAHFTVNGQDVTATSAACQKQIVFTPPAVPVYTCDLFSIQSDTTTRTVQVTGLNTTAQNGAVYNHAVIDWGDNSTPLSIANPVSQTHQYAADGTYTITATAHFTVNGQDVSATSPACQEKVTYKTLPPPVTPVYTCDKFQITADANRMVKATAFAVTATGGATFKSATINWGDNTPVTTVNSVAGVTGQTHQFNADGTFMVTTTATFLVNGQEVTASGPQCQAQVKFVPNKPPETPVFSCDQFEIQAEPNRTVKLTAFATTAKDGATFAIASIDWGDNSTPLSTNNVVGQTHQYAADGTYVVTATAHFTVGGKDLVAGSAQCQKQVTYSSAVPPIVTPPTATPPSTPTGTLVNTGPGANLAAMFAVTTAIGMLAYRRLLARSLRG